MEKVHLSLKSTQHDLQSMFRDVQIDGTFADVTLVSNDQVQTQAHQCIISACSPVIKDLLLINPSPHTLIYLCGIKNKDLQSLLQVLYLGQVTFDQEDIKDIIDLALEVKELIDYYEESEKMTNEKVVSEESLKIYEEVGIKVDIKDCIDFKSELLITDDEKPENILSEQLSDKEVKIEGSNENPFTCKDCEQIYKTKDSLKYHRKSKCEASIERSFSCEGCELVFKARDTLRYHKRSKHDGIRYACDLCEYQATKQSNLYIHKQYAHSGIRYFCNQCDFKAATQSRLKIHRQSIHEGILFACNQCDYKAKKKCQIKVHEESKHIIIIDVINAHSRPHT